MEESIGVEPITPWGWGRCFQGSLASLLRRTFLDGPSASLMRGIWGEGEA